MIKSIGFSIIFLSVILLSLFIIFGCKQYLIRKRTKYSFLNMFPDEIIIRTGKDYYVSYIISFYCLVIFLSSIFYILPIILKSAGYFSILGDLYPLAFLSVISSISLFLMIVIFPLEINYKAHLTCFVVYVVSVVSKSLVGVSLFDSLKSIDENVSIIFEALAGLIFFVIFLLLCNPALMSWYKMKRENNSNGEEVILRPKKLPLAYTEWISIFGEAFINIVIVVGLLILI